MALFSRVRVLTESDVEEATRLYAKSCRYIKYFQDMFGKIDCSEDIYREFYVDVEAAVKQGNCYGLFESKNMVGVLLSINWFKYKEELPAYFNHMFLNDCAYTPALNSYANQFSNNVYFIFAIAVRDGKQCQGIGRKLLKYYVRATNKKDTIFSDWLYDHAESLWLKEGFQIVDITPTVENPIKIVVKLAT